MELGGYDTPWEPQLFDIVTYLWQELTNIGVGEEHFLKPKQGTRKID